MSEQNQKSLAQIGFEAFAETTKLGRWPWDKLSERDREEYELIANAIEKEVLRRNGITPKLPGQRAYEIYYNVFAPGCNVPFVQQLAIVQNAFAAVERELTKRDEDTGTH